MQKHPEGAESYNPFKPGDTAEFPSQVLKDFRRYMAAATLASRDVWRFKAAREHLDATPIPPEPMYVDKFHGGMMRPYGMGEVFIPERVHLRGLDHGLINQPNVSVGFTGASTPSEQSEGVVRRLARGIAEYDGKAAVVSGGAYGVDTYAHSAALDERLRTIAVRATLCPNEEIEAMGIQRGSSLEKYLTAAGLMGAEGTALARRILSAGGLLLSEYERFEPENQPPGAAGVGGDVAGGPELDFDKLGRRLLARDRLISAASDVVVLTECIERSGSLDTAIRACIQGKTVVAIDWRRIPEFRDAIGEYDLWKARNHIQTPDGADRTIAQVDRFDEVWKERFTHVPRVEGNDMFLSYLGGNRGGGLFRNSYRFPTEDVSMDDLAFEFSSFLEGLRFLGRIR